MRYSSRGSRERRRFGTLFFGALACILAAAPAQPAAAQSIGTTVLFKSSLNGATVRINGPFYWGSGFNEVVKVSQYQLLGWPAGGAGTLTIDSVSGVNNSHVFLHLEYSGTFTVDQRIRFRVNEAISGGGGWVTTGWADVFAEDPKMVVGSVTGTPTESGGTASFPVRLRTRPSATVRVVVTSRDTTEGTVPPDTLEFTTANWGSNQTVTVTGVDDATADGDQNYNINLDPSSTDTDYNGLDSVDVAMTTVDDDGGPTVSAVTITSTPSSGDTYELGERIEVDVGFSQAVDVVGTPLLALGVGSDTVQAAYATGHGSSTLTFRYNVLHGDEDTDGISIGAGALGLAGGARIRVQGGVGGASVEMSSYAITNSASHKVDATQGPPGVSGVSVRSPDQGVIFQRGEQIQVTVTFSRAVEVTGTPQVALGIGANTRQANYARGSGTTSLVFGYTVVAADSDLDGLSIGASALGLNGGAVRESGGTENAFLGLGRRAISNSPSHRVDGSSFSAPTILSVTRVNRPANNNSFTRGEVVRVSVNYDRRVTVTGVPSMLLYISTQTSLTASYASGSGTKSVVFRYVVQAGQVYTNGYAILGQTIALNGGTIKDARDGTTDADVVIEDLQGSNSNSNYRLDGGWIVAPGVTGVTLSTPQSGDTFIRDDTIDVTVRFNRVVAVTGTPQAAMTIGSTVRGANYARGTGSEFLVFRYPVVLTDTDTNGLSVDSLALNSGTMLLPGTTTPASRTLGSHAISNSASGSRARRWTPIWT